MAKILAGHHANAWFRYEGGEIHKGAKGFELDITRLRTLDECDEWGAILETFCVEDDGQRIGDFVGREGELELSLCPGCSFKGPAKIASATFKAAVDAIMVRVFVFEGIGDLQLPGVE